jgi:hypothetical protein
MMLGIAVAILASNASNILYPIKQKSQNVKILLICLFY